MNRSRHHGNRISTKEDFEAILLMPSNFESLGMDADLERLNQCSCALPNASISTQLSAPQMTAQMTMKVMSSNSWRQTWLFPSSNLAISYLYFN